MFLMFEAQNAFLTKSELLCDILP